VRPAGTATTPACGLNANVISPCRMSWRSHDTRGLRSSDEGDLRTTRRLPALSLARAGAAHASSPTGRSCVAQGSHQGASFSRPGGFISARYGRCLCRDGADLWLCSSQTGYAIARAQQHRSGRRPICDLRLEDFTNGARQRPREIGLFQYRNTRFYPGGFGISGG